MATFGYARISTGEQNLEAQREALLRAGCSPANLIEELSSGTIPAMKRPRLSALIAGMERGDELVVAKLDRLGRNASDTMAVIASLEGRGISVRLLDLGADTSTAAGRLVLGVLASVCEWEHGVLVERTKAGIEAARRAGRLPGRRHRLDERQRNEAIAMRVAGHGVRKVAAAFGVPKSVVGRLRPAHRT